MSAAHLLKRPLTTPLNRLEERVASNLVRRKVALSSDKAVTIQTGGPVSEINTKMYVGI